MSPQSDIKRPHFYLRLQPSVKQSWMVITMPTWTMATTDESVQSAIDVGSTLRTSPVDMWIGRRVRIKRTSRGVSQQEFCKLLDIGWNDLAAFEAGAKRINANLLFRVAKSLDVRPDFFFRGYVEEQPKAI
jgi:DNA-binding transcriptional regulator YiaG